MNRRVPSVWPSLIVAVVLAVIVPTTWLEMRASVGLTDGLGFEGMIATFVYMPLTFGIAWPLLVAAQTVQPNSAPRRHLARVYFAIPLFGFSVLCSIPCVTFEAGAYRRAAIERHKIQAADERAVRQATADSAAVRTRGLASFSLPLTPSQKREIVAFVYSNEFRPADAEAILEHYASVPAILESLAGRRHVTPSMLDRLYRIALRLPPAGPDSADVFALFRGIATSPNASPELLASILDADVPAARLLAADNAHLPGAMRQAFLLRAARSPLVVERRFAASDTLLPPGVLRELANDSAVRIQLAQNASTPVNVLERLAADSSTHFALWNNRNTTLALMQRLASSPNRNVSHDAAQLLSILAEVRQRGFEAVRPPLTELQRRAIGKFVRDEPVSAEQLRVAAAQYDSLPDVMDALFGRDLPPDVLRQLFDAAMRDIDRSIALSQTLCPLLGRNPHLPPDILRQMIESPLPWIRQSAAKNPNLTTEQRAAYRERAKTSPYVSELLGLINDPETPTSILSYLVQNPLVTWDVALNSATPRAVLAQLVASPDPWVAALAAERVAATR